MKKFENFCEKHSCFEMFLWFFFVIYIVLQVSLIRIFSTQKQQKMVIAENVSISKTNIQTSTATARINVVKMKFEEIKRSALPKNQVLKLNVLQDQIQEKLQSTGNLTRVN
jgi:hypothetical protein